MRGIHHGDRNSLRKLIIHRNFNALTVGSSTLKQFNVLNFSLQRLPRCRAFLAVSAAR